MKKETFKLDYLQPEMKIVELKARQVLCQSGLQDYQKGDNIDGFDFN